MKLAVEIYTLKPLSIKMDTYFKTALITSSYTISESIGYDLYEFSAIITSEKRLAGLGREFIYTLNAFPLGMGPIEARPAIYISLDTIPDDISLTLQTNSTLNPGLLADNLGLRLVNDQGKSLDIPFCRPDITILWDGNNQYQIPLIAFLKGKLFREVCYEVD